MARGFILRMTAFVIQMMEFVLMVMDFAGACRVEAHRERRRRRVGQESNRRAGRDRLKNGR